MNLTPKQLKILRLIRDHRITHGYSPTMQELADDLGVSKVTVFEHVEALIKKGALRREPNKARSLSLVDDTVIPDETRPLQFPLVGRIAAGQPIERCEDNDQVDLQEIFGPRVGQRAGTYALRVEGNSMRDEGILEGDYVLVEQRSVANNGEQVVALLRDGESTLKTFYRESGGRVRLQPANPDFEPIIVDERECNIRGVVIGVLRTYR